MTKEDRIKAFRRKHKLFTLYYHCVLKKYVLFFNAEFFSNVNIDEAIAALTEAKEIMEAK